jgi:hypothetical protein
MDKEKIGILVGIVTIVSVFYGLYTKNLEFQHTLGKKIREDYEFAKKFFEDCEKNPNRQKYIIELGYLGITQDRSIKPEEIKYILSLQEPTIALFWFKKSRRYLDFLITNIDQKITFKLKYKKKISRTIYKISRFLYYTFWSLAALTPFIYAANLPFLPLSLALFWAVLCFSLAIIFLNEGVNMSFAEKLVNLQPFSLRTQRKKSIRESKIRRLSWINNKLGSLAKQKDKHP